MRNESEWIRKESEVWTLRVIINEGLTDTYAKLHAPGLCACYIRSTGSAVTKLLVRRIIGSVSVWASAHVSALFSSGTEGMHVQLVHCVGGAHYQLDVPITYLPPPPTASGSSHSPPAVATSIGDIEPTLLKISPIPEL